MFRLALHRQCLSFDEIVKPDLVCYMAQRYRDSSCGDPAPVVGERRSRMGQEGLAWHAEGHVHCPAVVREPAIGMVYIRSPLRGCNCL